MVRCETLRYYGVSGPRATLWRRRGARTSYLLGAGVAEVADESAGFFAAFLAFFVDFFIFLVVSVFGASVALAGAGVAAGAGAGVAGAGAGVCA